MNRLRLGLGLLLVLAACGGADGDDVVEASGDGVVTVSTPDGRAVLTLTAASLPDGFTTEDLQIDWSQGLSGEPGAPLVGVRLQPDGLALDQSASLRFELPDTDSNQFMVAHVSENVFEFVAGEIESDSDHLFVSVSVEHFSSVLVFTPDGLATVASTATPSIVSVDETQLVESEVWIEPIVVDLWMPISFGVNQQWQLISFGDISVSQNPNDHHGTVQWQDATFGANSWDPQFRISEKTPDDVAVYFAGSSTCLEANSVDPVIYNVIDLSLTVTAKGPVVDRALFDFARAIGEVQATGAYAEGNPFMEAVGANVKGYIVLEDSVESECTHVSTATSSTISTLPPVDDDGEDESAGCAVDLDGPNQQVVVNAIVPIVDEHGNLLFNVSTCGDVDPVDPFGEFYSAYYQCDQFGFQIHANVTTVLGTPTAAHTLTGGSFLYNTGMPPSGSGPTEVICKFASWDNPEAAVKTGEVVIFYPPGPPAKLTDEELRALYGEPATDLLNPSAAMVGSYNGELHFVPRPGSPSDVGYSSDFIVTIIAESDGTYSIRLEQRPSGQISTGKFLGQTTVFLASGTGAGHSETYFGGVRRGPDGQLEFVGTTWGGSASLSFDSQATILALASAEVGDGVINLENSASVYSGFGTAQEPLEERSREELEEVAQQMQNPDADLESVGPIGWLLTVVGQLFASEG